MMNIVAYLRHARAVETRRSVRDIARKDCTRANVVQEIRRERTFGRRHQPKSECNKGIRSRDVEEPLHLRKGRKTANNIGGRSGRQQRRLESMGNSIEVFGKAIGLQFRKRAARSSVMLRNTKNWTLWRGQPPPKRKKRLHTEQEPVM
jgi:hypothetical protein